MDRTDLCLISRPLTNLRTGDVGRPDRGRIGASGFVHSQNRFFARRSLITWTHGHHSRSTQKGRVHGRSRRGDSQQHSQNPCHVGYGAVSHIVKHRRRLRHTACHLPVEFCVSELRVCHLCVTLTMSAACINLALPAAKKFSSGRAMEKIQEFLKRLTENGETLLFP